MKKIFVFLFLFFFFISFANASNKFSVKLDKCIDGDTAKFFINGESKTVRFLSINTPEIAHDDIVGEYYGKEASDYTCKLLKRASIIKLQYDPKSDKTDKYGRVLAWVFIDDDLLQENLVKNGYAEVKYVYDDYLYSRNLKELEADAKEKKLGMWDNFHGTKKNNIEFLSMHELIFCAIVVIFLLIISLLKKLFK